MLLAEPAAYVPGTLDLAADPELRRYWLELFRNHIAQAVAHVAREHPEEPELVARMEQAARAFRSHVDALARAGGGDFLDTLALCEARERMLRAAGVDDPFRRAKEREGRAALALLPARLEELDAVPEAARLEALVQGMFAGNVFDLGSHATAARFEHGELAFELVRERLRPRPWLVDDFERVRARYERGIGCAFVFVDNAGSDVVLGMLPFARELLRRGTRVVLSANRTPALNDVTHDELVAIVAEVASWEPVFAAARDDGQLSLVTSGSGLPLLDLRAIGAELREALARCAPDLVVLEGMGRAIESNWNARLACDVLKIAMIKDVSVARFLGGELYDLVCRFEPACAAAPYVGPAPGAGCGG